MNSGQEKVCQVSDREDTDLGVHLAASHRFIREGRSSGGCVLIHCLCGVSRSVTIVLHHLVQEGTSLASAWHQVKKVRPVAQPNHGFWRLLVEVEREVRGEVSMEEVPGRKTKEEEEEER